MSQEPDDTRPGVQTRAGGLTVRRDDSARRGRSATAGDVAGTREEVVRLLEKVTPGPFAAKRLNLLLSRASHKHKSRYGQLRIAAGDPFPAAPPRTG